MYVCFELGRSHLQLVYCWINYWGASFNLIIWSKSKIDSKLWTLSCESGHDLSPDRLVFNLWHLSMAHGVSVTVTTGKQCIITLNIVDGGRARVENNIGEIMGMWGLELSTIFTHRRIVPVPHCSSTALCMCILCRHLGASVRMGKINLSAFHPVLSKKN